MAVPIPKAPATHLATLTTNTVEFTLDPKTNKISIEAGEAVRWAFQGSEGAAPTLPTSGDHAGLALAAGELLELELDVGTDRVAGLSIFVEPTVDPTALSIIVEE